MPPIHYTSERRHAEIRPGEIWTVAPDDEDAVGGEVVASGEDETYGCMKDEAVLSILDEHCTNS